MSLRRKLIGKMAKRVVKSKKTTTRVGKGLGKAMSAKQKAALMKAVKASATKRSKGGAIKISRATAKKLGSKKLVASANKKAIGKLAKSNAKNLNKALAKAGKVKVANKTVKKAIAKGAKKKLSTKKKVALTLLGAAGAQGAMAGRTMKKQNTRMAKWKKEQQLERRQNSKRGRGRSVSSYKRAKSQ